MKGRGGLCNSTKNMLQAVKKVWQSGLQRICEARSRPEVGNHMEEHLGFLGEKRSWHSPVGENRGEVGLLEKKKIRNQSPLRNITGTFKKLKRNTSLKATGELDEDVRGTS